MHTDRKIGFAMGILLIGIVAALFFRNEPLVDSSVPSVRREKELNERLRERDVAVYLKDDSKDSESANDDEDPQWSASLRDVLKGMGERNKTVPTPIGSSRKNLRSESEETERDQREDRPAEEELFEAYLSQRDRAPTQISARPPQDRRPGPLPPLFAAEGSSTFPGTGTESSRQIGSTTADAGVDTDNVADASGKNPETHIPEDFEEYVVKYGDTLSGIAQKMLGSQARYREIYEANRDRMSSPDKLDVGKPLRIPRVAASPGSTQ